MQCTAKSKQSGKPCKRPSTQGRTVCHIHGGKTPVGLGLPQTTTGRYSKFLPERMLGRYHEAGADPALLSLREDIALQDARLADLLGRVETGESGARWKAVKAAYTAWAKRRGKEDEDDLRLELQAAIFAGASDMEAWAEIHQVLMQREKLVASERDAMVKAKQMVSVDQAMMIVTQVVDSVRRHVSDRDALAGISADIGRLLTISAGSAEQARTA